MLYATLIVLHVIVSTILVMVVLLQSGKRADLAGAFGGGGSQTAFGARGAATILSRITTISAVLFMVTSLSLSILSSTGRKTGSALDSVETTTDSAPAEPGLTPAEIPADIPEE
jgi:preprotein translocase subunit SecG